MKQTARIISLYSSDTAGVCSMLYELGGMTVVHDASGCNSTYSTHDEPRWYRMDSMIYISALTEQDAILGNDDKFAGDVITAIRELHPRFAALCGSPMPMMIGTDFDAIARQIQTETGIPVFGLHTNGIRSYIDGANQALSAYLNTFCTKTASKIPHSVNILGATPLDFSEQTIIDSIRDWLNKEGFQVISCMAMGSSPDAISNAGAASVNLVISSTGKSAAEYLKNTFGTPYVAGVPYGEKYAAVLAEELRKAELTGENRISCAERNSPGTGFVIVGESIAAGSLARMAELEFGIPAKVITPAPLGEFCSHANDLHPVDEEEVANIFKTCAGILADPMFAPIAPEQVPFHRYPHEAFSGRCFRREIPNWIGRTPDRRMFSC